MENSVATIRHRVGDRVGRNPVDVELVHEVDVLGALQTEREKRRRRVYDDRELSATGRAGSVEHTNVVANRYRSRTRGHGRPAEKDCQNDKEDRSNWILHAPGRGKGEATLAPQNSNTNGLFFRVLPLMADFYLGLTDYGSA